MIVNMLRAVAQMLEKPNKSKIECARIILNEVIINIEKNNSRITIQSESSQPDLESLSPEAVAAQQNLLSE